MNDVHAVINADAQNQGKHDHVGGIQGDPQPTQQAEQLEHP